MVQLKIEIKEETERSYMHCQAIACTRSFHIGLTSAEGQKLECFYEQQIVFL